MYNITKKGYEIIAKSNGKIGAERLYYLKQDAEIYTLAEFIECYSDVDLSKSQLIEIWNLI